MRTRELLDEDPEYQDLISGRKRSDKEKALENRILAITEAELGRLNKRIAGLKGKVKESKLEGELKVEKVRTNAALLLGQKIVSKSASFMLTPWNEQGGLVENVHRQNEEPKRIGPDSDEGKRENRRGALDDMADMIPKKAQPSISLLSRIFSKTTPAQTAVIFFLTIVVIGVWSEWSKSHLRETATSNKELLSNKDQRISELETEVESQKSQLDDYEKSKQDLELANINIANLQEDLKTAKSDFESLKKESEGEAINIKAQYDATITKLASGQDEATKTLLAEKDKRIEILEASEKKLTNQYEKALSELKTSSKSENTLKIQVVTLNQQNNTLKLESEKKDTRINNLRAKETKYIALRGFTLDVLGEVDDFTREINDKDSKNRVKSYRSKYKEIYSSFESTLKDIGVRNYGKWGGYSVP